MSHEDILPYNSAEQVPIQHELFERFLLYNPAKSKPSSAASAFQLMPYCADLTWTCVFSLFCSSSIHSQRHAEGVAGEEPPLAGAVGRPQGDHGEHPRHCDPLLHGHEGASTNRA